MVKTIVVLDDLESGPLTQEERDKIKYYTDYWEGRGKLSYEGTVTGRLTKSEPEKQYIVACDFSQPNSDITVYTLVNIDYAVIELREIAAISPDMILKDGTYIDYKLSQVKKP